MITADPKIRSLFEKVNIKIERLEAEGFYTEAEFLGELLKFIDEQPKVDIPAILDWIADYEFFFEGT